MTNRGQPPIRLQPYRFKTELWAMDADGANKRQLTRFNTPGAPEHVPGDIVVPADSAWSPDGTRLAVLVLTRDPNGPERGRGSLFLVSC